MSINRKRGSIDLARSLCYQINGAADDSDDMDGGGYGSVDIAEILSAEVVRLREALAQPEQEPVAWADHGVVNWIADKQFNHASLLYTTPLQRTWVGLTDDEMEATFIECGGKWNGDFWKIEDADFHPFLRTIEAKLKQKNGYAKEKNT